MPVDRPARPSAFRRRAAMGCTAVAVIVGGLVVATPAFAATNPDGAFSDLQNDLGNASAGNNDIAQLTGDVSGGTLVQAPGTTRILDLDGHTLTRDTLQLTTIVGGQPQGANLTVIDSTGAGDEHGSGHLIVEHTSDRTTAAIEVDADGSSLTIKQAVVDVAASPTGTAAAIGGGGLVDLYTTPRDTESAGSIDIADGAVVTATGSQQGAAIGGGRLGSGGDITIEQTAAVSATGQGSAAAIGSGASALTGQTTITVNGYGVNERGGVGVDVSATTTGHGAAIGGGYQGAGGAISINGYSHVSATSDEAGIGDGEFATGNSQITVNGYSTVTARGGAAGGAGIGGSNTAYGSDTVTIGGNSTVNATGTAGPGIGGERNRYSTTVSIGDAANVTAVGGGNGAGIGGGDSPGAGYQPGATLSLSGTADLTVGTNNSSISAIGPGAGSGTGNIGLNGGTLHLGAGQQITMPSGAVLTNNSLIQNAGTLATSGSGVIDNESVIVDSGSGSVQGNLHGQAYAVSYDPGSGQIASGGNATVLANTMQKGAVPIASAQPGSAGKFIGWNTAPDGSGTTVTDSTDLSTIAGAAANGAVPVKLYAIYVIDPALPGYGLPQATVGTPFAGGVGVTAGTAPLSYGYTGSLPAGLSIDSGSGAITGTPTSSGSYTFTVSAKNADATATHQYTIVVAAAPMTVAAARLAGSAPHLGGSRLDVTIGGLETNESYTVTIGGRMVLAGTAAQFGAFTRTVIVPSSIGDGSQAVVVTGSRHASASGTSIVTAAVKKALTLKASSTSPKHGAKLTFTASHLYGGEPLHLVVKGPQGESVAAKASGSGGWTLVLKHGLSKKGHYTVTLTGLTTGRSAMVRITVK